MPASILIVDDEKHTREGLNQALEALYETYMARDADEALRLMEDLEFDVILTDLRMAGKSGMSVIDRALQLPHRPVCIMMTAYGSVETAVEAMKRGAYDFLSKPVNVEKLEILIKRALREKSLSQENIALHERLDRKFSFEGLVGKSKSFIKILEEAKQVAKSKATVLITGETGTGKERIAQIIHQNSTRARKPFVAVHCASLPANLLESELFGHEKGAFTGAVERRIGRFESAGGGTLFLDEIGEIDATVQVKLLRFLETKEIERVGNPKPIRLDVRLVCATNRNLPKMVEEGTFREDLLYRLNVVTLELPPLRDRREDISNLLDYYLKYFANENECPTVIIDPKALAILEGYTWPGNIRELRNFCEKVTVMNMGGVVGEYDVEEKFLGSPKKYCEKTQPVTKRLSKEESEKRLLRNALREAKGNRSKAADLMGISRRTLHRKLEKWPDLADL